MGGDMRLVGVLDEVVKYVDDLVVLLKTNVEIEFVTHTAIDRMIRV